MLSENPLHMIFPHTLWVLFKLGEVIHAITHPGENTEATVWVLLDLKVTVCQESPFP